MRASSSSRPRFTSSSCGTSTIIVTAMRFCCAWAATENASSAASARCSLYFIVLLRESLVYDVTMKAWSMAAHGGPERLELVERAPRGPSSGELLVRVAAAALNFSDLLMLRGEYQ